MLPDFSLYSLAVVKDDNIIYKDDGRSLTPLISCIKNNSFSDCILFDCVIGLAAARLIIHSKMFVEVFTDLASEKAVSLLKQNNMPINAKKIVPNILRKDGKGICPMELKALDMSNKDFFNLMINN